ncbi:MAG: alpha/beta fold hydrolase [Acidimicrobiales bacterium]
MYAQERGRPASDDDGDAQEPQPAGHEDEVFPFSAGDGRPLNLVHVVGDRHPTRGPVLLVHGAGVRANIFRALLRANLVDVLAGAGFDVWLLNWRASIDLPANQWTLDQAAAHDHPVAVRKLLELTGAGDVKAVIHCQGSTSFMMAAVAGLLPGVNTIVSNAVSLHPVIPLLARWKIDYLCRPVKTLTRYLDPHWGVEAPTWLPRRWSLT